MWQWALLTASICWATCSICMYAHTYEVCSWLICISLIHRYGGCLQQWGASREVVSSRHWCKFLTLRQRVRQWVRQSVAQFWVSFATMITFHTVQSRSNPATNIDCGNQAVSYQSSGQVYSSLIKLLKQLQVVKDIVFWYWSRLFRGHLLYRAAKLWQCVRQAHAGEARTHACYSLQALFA